jgi:hypothetical protein
VHVCCVRLGVLCDYRVTGVSRCCPCTYPLEKRKEGMLQECYKSVTRVLQECHRGVPCVLRHCQCTYQVEGRKEEVLHECYNNVTRVLQECYRGVAGVLQGSYLCSEALPVHISSSVFLCSPTNVSISSTLSRVSRVIRVIRIRGLGELVGQVMCFHALLLTSLVLPL